MGFGRETNFVRQSTSQVTDLTVYPNEFKGEAFNCVVVDARTTYKTVEKDSSMYMRETLYLICQIVGTEYYIKHHITGRTRFFRNNVWEEWGHNTNSLQDFATIAELQKGKSAFENTEEYSDNFNRGEIYHNLNGVRVVLVCAKVGEREWNNKVYDTNNIYLFNDDRRTAVEIEAQQKEPVEFNETLLKCKEKYRKWCDEMGISADDTIIPDDIPSQPQVSGSIDDLPF